MKKQYIRTTFGATAQFGRRVDSFYERVDWELGWSEPNEHKPKRKVKDTIRVWRKEAVINTSLHDALIDLLSKEVR